MVEQDAFERTLVVLYEAALTEEKWVDAAASINNLIGTMGFSFTCADLSRPVEPKIHLTRFFVDRERRDDLEQLYLRDYQRCGVFRRLLSLRSGEMVGQSDLYTDWEKKRSPGYRELRRVGLVQNGLFMRLDWNDWGAIILSFDNAPEHVGFGHDQIRTIRRLAPHIRQFARIRETTANTNVQCTPLSALLENEALAIVQLDRSGRILEASDRARAILQKRDGLRDAAGALVARKASEDADLQRLLAKTLHRSGAQRAGGAMRITRPRARMPLVVETCPVQTEAGEPHSGNAAALVLLIDPVSRPRVDADFVVAVLGLTPAESRVAVEMAAGVNVAAIAQVVGCAESSVRTHVRRIYRKLGINRQTQLVRAVLALEGSARIPYGPPHRRR